MSNRHHSIFTGLGAAIVVVLLTSFVAYQTLSAAANARAAADAAEANLERARILQPTLARLVPPKMGEGGFVRLMDWLEQDLVKSGVSAKSIRSANVENQTDLSGVGASLQQARLDLDGLTLKQVATVLNSVESCGFPCWIETADLRTSSNGRWSTSLQIQWLTQRDRTTKR